MKPPSSWSVHCVCAWFVIHNEYKRWAIWHCFLPFVFLPFFFEHSSLSFTIYVMSNADSRPTSPVSPQRPSNYWINNGGWIGKWFSFLYLCNLLIYYQMAPSILLIFTSPLKSASVRYSSIQAWRNTPKSLRLRGIASGSLPLLSCSLLHRPWFLRVSASLLLLHQNLFSCILMLAAAPIPSVGHLVSVLMQFLVQMPGPASRGSKVVKKKTKLTKSDYIVLEGITHTDFITSYLSIHGLSEQYSPGVHSGPAFKLYWTGSVYIQFWSL